MAADKVKLLSSGEDVGSENIRTRSRNGRKTPLRFACTSADKVLSDCEGDVSCEGESLGPDPAAAARGAGQDLNGNSDSEGAVGSARTSRHTRSHSPSAPSATKRSSVRSSEEDSQSRVPRRVTGRKFSSASTLAQKTTAENNSEEELSYGLRRWNGRRLRTYGKAPFSKSEVIGDSQAVADVEVKRKRLRPELENVRMHETRESSKSGPDTSPRSSDLGSVTESDEDCTDKTKTKRRKTKGKAKVVRKGKTFTTSPCKAVRRPRQSKRPRLAVDDDWEDVDCAGSKRVLRRSKIKTRNQGRRTVRYHDGDDDRSLENGLEFNDCTL